MANCLELRHHKLLLAHLHLSTCAVGFSPGRRSTKEMLEKNCSDWNDTRAAGRQPRSGWALAASLVVLAGSFLPSAQAQASVDTALLKNQPQAGRGYLPAAKANKASKTHVLSLSPGSPLHPQADSQLFLAEQPANQAEKLSTAGNTTESQTSTTKAQEPPAAKPEAAVLNPENYVGLVRAGYAAAQQIPEICAKLFCYCGCDLTDCHGDLLDCFTCDHGVDCKICQDEAILALKLHKKGKSLEDIQKAIDKKYSKEYPFEAESEALKKYKASRSWADSSADSKPQAGKRLRKDGSCCAGKNEEGQEPNHAPKE